MIYRLRSIVAGIGHPDDSDPILAAAIEIAERTHAALHLVHTFELPSLMWDASARMGVMPQEVLDDYSTQLRDGLQAAVRALTSSENVHYEIAAAPAAATIVEHARRVEADLVIVGASQHGRLARTLLGTTAQRVLRSAPVPVLVIRPPLPLHLRRVLLTTDLSDFAAGIHEAGLDVLETLFEDDEPQLRSLFVYSAATDPLLVAIPDPVEPIAGEELASFLKQRRARARAVEGAVRHGEPAREIVAETVAWEPDLLVVGTHARKAPMRWLLGSVAEASIRDARTSVLVIPATVREQRSLPVAVAAPSAQTSPS